MCLVYRKFMKPVLIPSVNGSQRRSLSHCCHRVPGPLTVVLSLWIIPQSRLRVSHKAVGNSAMHFAYKKYAVILAVLIVCINVLNFAVYRTPNLLNKYFDRDVLVRDNSESENVSRWKKVWAPDNVEQQMHALFNDGAVTVSDQPRYDGVDVMHQVILVSSPEHEVLMVSYCGQWLSIVVRRPPTFDVYTLEATFVILYL